MTEPAKFYWLAIETRVGNPTERWASLWICEENELKAMTQSETLLTGLIETKGKLYAY